MTIQYLQGFYPQLIIGGQGYFCQKKTSQLKWKGPKKAKKRFFEKSENLLLWTNQCNWRAEKRGEYADFIQD